MQFNYLNKKQSSRKFFDSIAFHKSNNKRRIIMNSNDQTIDSEGTTQEEAQKLLSNLSENGFSGDVGAVALVLGRQAEEIQSILDGQTEIDEDLLMKIRGIAEERNIEID
jgi:hypothetical protein